MQVTAVAAEATQSARMFFALLTMLGLPLNPAAAAPAAVHGIKQYLGHLVLQLQSKHGKSCKCSDAC